MCSIVCFIYICGVVPDGIDLSWTVWGLHFQPDGDQESITLCFPSCLLRGSHDTLNPHADASGCLPQLQNLFQQVHNVFSDCSCSMCCVQMV